MYLSKLRIYGFKSFANKVEVNFPKDGITSVVGPNGCGKSNIVDAIRWVLGEQKVKSLRSTKMEDVIFSGTANLPPMNMAEVSLVIQNDKGLLPGGHTHVMITRQAYRNGESNYMINNQTCRLKDIQHLFYDTGMGAASYSLMEARMIDSVLSEKDEERRVLFEEACGISKYKKQRTETKRQLEHTSVDLARVEDNLRHTKQSVNMFERQAKKAEKWKNLSEQIRNTEISFQLDQYNEIKEKYRGYVATRDENRKKSERIEAEKATKETILQEKKLEAIEDEQRLSAANQRVSNTKAKAVQVTNEIQRAKDRISYLEQSLIKQKESQDETVRRVASYVEEKNKLKEERVTLEKELEALKSGLDTEEQKKAELLSSYLEKRERAEELSKDRIEFLEDFTRWKDELGRSRAQKSVLESQIEEQEEQHEKEYSEINSYREQVESLEKSGLETGTQRDELRQKLQELEETHRSNREALSKARETFRELEKQKVSLESEQKLLQALHDSFEGTSKGTQHLLKNFPDKINSIIADKLTVEEEYVSVVEGCVGEALQCLMIDGGAESRELLEDLQKNKSGKAWLYKGGRSFKRNRPDLENRPEFKGWILNWIQAEPELQSFLQFLVGHYVLVDSLQTAESWASEFTDFDLWLVTPEGYRMHTSGLIQGGDPFGESHGLLEQKAKLEKNAAELESLITRWEADESAIVKLQENLNDVESKIGESRQQLKEQEEHHRQVQEAMAVKSSHLKTLEERQRQFEIKQETLNAQLEEVTSKMETFEKELESKENERLVLENQFTEFQQLAREAEELKNKHEMHSREKQSAFQQIKSETEKIDQRLRHLEDSEKEHSSIQLKLDLEGQEWGVSIRDNKEKIEKFTTELNALDEQLTQETAERDNAKAIYDEKIFGSEDLRNAIQKLNQEFLEISKILHEIEIKIEQNSNHLRNVEERMAELYGVDFEAQDFEYEQVEYDRNTVERELKELKVSLKNLGNVNVGALEEYEKEKEHLEEVEQQFNDLDKARIGLERAIRKLDKLAREQFVEFFQEIQKNFQKVFSTLFEGGQAFLTLEEGVDPLEAKIEINASPSGKKMRGVTLLSGGERALTAISMLFSLYLVRTSPYCIMDEVDGPLDDANIGRFINLLRRFSDQTQFLVVTHNKRTMAASDMLYGVTQEVKGISQLSSVKLDEASLIAA